VFEVKSLFLKIFDGGVVASYKTADWIIIAEN
jgi:hypothetical protein